MSEKQGLKSKLNRLYGQRAGAFVNKNYSLVLSFSQEIENIKKSIAKPKGKSNVL